MQTLALLRADAAVPLADDVRLLNFIFCWLENRRWGKISTRGDDGRKGEKWEWQHEKARKTHGLSLLLERQPGHTANFVERREAL